LSFRLPGAPEQIRKNRQELARLLQQAERRQTAGQYQSARAGTACGGKQPAAGQLAERAKRSQCRNYSFANRPERAQSEISNNQKRIQEISNQLKATKEGGKPLLSSERQDALRAEVEALQARNRLRQAELASNSVLQDLASSARELLATRVQAQEDYLATLQGLLIEKRQAASELAVQEQSLKVEKAGEDTLLLKESSINLQISDYLLTITERRNQLAQKSLEVRQQLDSVQQAEQAMEEQIAALQGSVLLAKILYQQKQSLPQPSFDSTLADQIADSRLYQFQLRQYRDMLERPDGYIDRLLQEDKEDADGQLREALQEVLRVRNGLIERLNHEINAYLSEAISVQLNQKQLQALSLQVRTLLDEHMFWIPSNRPLDRDWLRQLSGRLQKQWKSLDGGTAFGVLWPVWRSYWPAFIPAFLLSLTILWKRRSLYQSIEHARPRIGHYLNDRQRFTPLAIGAVLLLSLPAFFWFSTAGWLAQLHTTGVPYEFGTACCTRPSWGWVFFCSLSLAGPAWRGQVPLWLAGGTGRVFAQASGLGGTGCLAAGAGGAAGAGQPVGAER
jgi:potassium efflux system protein